MKKIINKCTVLVIVLVASVTPPVWATFLHTNAQATMTSGHIYSTTYLSIGTAVDASIDFDVGVGTPSEYPSITSSSGTFTWNDGTPRVFNISSFNYSGYTSSGIYKIGFNGIGPTIGGLTATEFAIHYDVGVNPHTTIEELSDLLLSSTIERFRIGVFNNDATTGNGDLLTDVSGSVTPEPTTILLLGLGGLLVRKRRA